MTQLFSLLKTKLKNCYRNYRWMIYNYWRYRTIIAQDRDWDYTYMLELLQFKIQKMRDYELTLDFMEREEVINSYNRLDYLLQRQINMDYSYGLTNLSLEDKHLEEDWQEIWSICNRYGRRWWN